MNCECFFTISFILLSSKYSVWSSFRCKMTFVPRPMGSPEEDRNQFNFNHKYQSNQDRKVTILLWLVRLSELRLACEPKDY